VAQSAVRFGQPSTPLRSGLGSFVQLRSGVVRVSEKVVSRPFYLYLGRAAWLRPHSARVKVFGSSWRVGGNSQDIQSIFFSLVLPLVAEAAT
jgi:hypothetical protein